MGRDDSKMEEMINGDVTLSLSILRGGRLVGICIANFVHVRDMDAVYIRGISRG